MLPIAAWPLQERRRIIGVFTDIDDTLTTDGAITADALQALHDLKAFGLHVIAITGRPVGWSEPFAQRWPVDSIVAENGAVALLRERCDTAAAMPAPRETRLEAPSFNNKKGLQPNEYGRKQLSKLYQQDAATRATNYAHMQTVAQRVVREVPLAQISQDSPGRETDIAIDHSEFAQLPPEQIAHAVRIMHSEGLHATVSSIHINGWIGEHNKLQSARWIVHQLWGRDLDAEMDRWAFIGDSTNDQLMFEAFAHSAGVANIARFTPQLAHLPRYVTQGARGAGFAEFVRILLEK